MHNLQGLSQASRAISRFFREFVPKNPAKFDFFVQDLSEALLRRKGVQISIPLKMKMTPKILAKGTNCPPVCLLYTSDAADE